MKVKTSKLIDATLDWAVAKCVGFVLPDMTHSLYDWFKAYGPRYSTDWAQGGPIIEREKIETYWHTALDIWAARHDGNLRYGPTPLIAAMRCYVASKLGDEIDIPDELA